MKEKLFTGIALVLIAALTFAGCSSGVSQEDILMIGFSPGGSTRSMIEPE